MWCRCLELRRDPRPSLQLNVPLPEGGWGALLEVWLDRVSWSTVPDLRSELAGAQLRRAVVETPESVIGAGGSAWGDLLLAQRGDGGFGLRQRQRLFDDDVLAWAERQLDVPPLNVTLHLRRLGPSGGFDDDVEVPGGDVQLGLGQVTPAWAILSAQFRVSPFGVPGEVGARQEELWLDAVRLVADELPVGFGTVTRLFSTQDTRLEAEAAHLGHGGFGLPRVVDHLGERLRGVGWLTVLGGELAARVGGAGALRDSGVFWSVEQRAGGSVLCVATPRYEQYTSGVEEQLLAVFAPLLEWADLPALHECPYQEWQPPT